jgi:hypothetical protein
MMRDGRYTPVIGDGCGALRKGGKPIVVVGLMGGATPIEPALNAEGSADSRHLRRPPVLAGSRWREPAALCRGRPPGIERAGAEGACEQSCRRLVGTE